MIPRKPEEPVGRELGQGYKYVSLGLTFAGGIVLFMGAGFLLDRWLGVLPVFTVAGTLAGSVLSFIRVYYRLKADEDADRASRKSKGRPW
jgi:F0F1-type ATP synthase assembly protein I